MAAEVALLLPGRAPPEAWQPPCVAGRRRWQAASAALGLLAFCALPLAALRGGSGATALLRLGGPAVAAYGADRAPAAAVLLPPEAAGAAAAAAAPALFTAVAAAPVVSTELAAASPTATVDAAPVFGPRLPPPVVPLAALPLAAAGSAAPAAKGGTRPPCAVLWEFSLGDMVGYGFGASLKQLEFMRIWASRHGCSMPVGYMFSQEWISWDLSPFWRSVLPDLEWAQRWDAAQPCGYVSKELVRCESADPALVAVTWDFEDVSCDAAFAAGALQTLRPRLAACPRPFGGAAYAALHVRRGDKAIEGKVFSLQAHLRELRRRWPDMRNIFLATDDADLLSRELEPGYNVTWTENELRWSGGSPLSSAAYRPGHHDNSEGSLRALLADVAGLAHASVLVGSAQSNFFRTGWVLNGALHAAAAPHRRRPWCYDLFVGAACDDRRRQVLAYCRKRQREEGACDLGRVARRCAAAAAGAPRR